MMNVGIGDLTRREALAGLGGALVLAWTRPAAWAQTAPPPLTVHKDPT